LEEDCCKMDEELVLGQKLLNEGKTEEALQVFLKLCASDEKDVAATILASLTYLELERYDLAFKVAQTGTSLFPGNEFQSRILFMSLVKLGQIEEAYGELDRYVNFSGRLTDEYDLMLSELRGEVGDDEYYKRSQIVDERAKRRNT